MGLHGIVMESMKMTHVYATKIHDIFWDRMRLTAYIYIWMYLHCGTQSKPWTASMNIAMAISSKQNLMFFIRAISLEIYIYMSYIVNLMIWIVEITCFTHHFPTHSPRVQWCAGGAQRPLHGWLHHHGGGLRSGTTGGEGWIFPWVFVCLPGIPSGKLT